MCVDVIGYKLGYKIIYKLEYGTSENINKDNYKRGTQDGI